MSAMSTCTQGKHRPLPNYSSQCLLFVFACLLCPGWSKASIGPLDFTLNATPAASLDLSGEWQVAQDPANTGKTSEWFRNGPVEGAVTAVVPNPIELTFPGYDGVIWYWCSFDAGELTAYDDVRIHFQGADYYAEAWLNGKYLGGNESALLPFAFDVKKEIRTGMNQLVVRVVDASRAKEIDGFQLGHVPGGRQHDNPMEKGWRHQNYGGLLLPVSVQAFRRPWIADGFIRPNVKQGKIDLDLTIVGNGAPGEWNAVIYPVYPQKGEAVVQETVQISPDRDGRARISFEIPNPHLWKVWDSFLYRIELSPKGGPAAGTTWRDRFGMREVSILSGRIAINGKPILQRSYLYNQIWPITLGVPFQDLARRDIELARATNANMLRCFSKTPVPATVEAADEVGILLQPETLGSWYLAAGEKEQQRLKNITERTVLLYRNHPSIFWWNILNESLLTDRYLGPYALREVLPSVHALDPTRPAMANDPIWHNVPNVWEPGRSEPSLPLVQSHYYQLSGLENHEGSWIRLRGRKWGEEPQLDTPFLALTEWGQNSSPDWDRLIESYRSSGVRQDAEDYVVYRKLLEMNQRWYEQSGVQKQGFPTLESVHDANREAVVHRWREHFALIWGNVHGVGHSLTSFEDSSYELSGIVDNWRNPKPVVFDAITELNQPLQINLWLRPASVYVSDEITFDATLVNEGRRLRPGNYQLTLKLIDERNHVVLRKEYQHEVAGDLIEFLMTQSVSLDVKPGMYRLEFELDGDNQKLRAGRPVQVFQRKPRKLAVRSTVWVWEKNNVLHDWLRHRGVQSRQGDVEQVQTGDLMLILDSPSGANQIKQIQDTVRKGACGIILWPEKVLTADGPKKSADDYAALLKPISGSWKPALRKIGWWGTPGAWSYGRTALALKHQFLDGLPQGAALEAQPAYQRVAPRFTWLLTDRPEHLAVDLAVVETNLNVDIPYTADLFSVPCGDGVLILNTLRLAENLGLDPAADRILENIIENVR